MNYLFTLNSVASYLLTVLFMNVKDAIYLLGDASKSAEGVANNTNPIVCSGMYVRIFNSFNPAYKNRYLCEPSHQDLRCSPFCFFYYYYYYYYYYFRLNPLFALVGMSKFKDTSRRIYLRNWRMKWLKWIRYNSITKTRPFKNTEKFTTKINWKFSDKDSDIFSYFCSKHRLWVPVRTASPRRF